MLDKVHAMRMKAFTERKKDNVIKTHVPVINDDKKA